MELGLATGCLTPKRGSLYFTTYFHLERDQWEMGVREKGLLRPHSPLGSCGPRLSDSVSVVIAQLSALMEQR